MHDDGELRSNGEQHEAFSELDTTSLAKTHSIGEILAAGEWRSAAFLRYCQTDELEISSVIDELMRVDDE